MMEEVIIKMSQEIIIAIAAILAPAVLMIIRYLWKKEKCFILMKKKIDELSESESGSHTTHEEFYQKIDELGNRTTALESKVDLMINHFNIK